MAKLSKQLMDFKAKVDEAETMVPKIAGLSLNRDTILPLIEDGMQKWYDAYDPKYYIRTYDLYRGVRDGTNIIFSGNTLKVDVVSDDVPDHLHDTGEYIFKGAFLRGIHGSSDICVSDAPYKIYEPQIEEKCDEKLSEALEAYIDLL